MKRSTVFLSVALLLLTVGGASAETIGYAYDEVGRLTHAYYPDGSIEYVYDPAGNLLNRIVTASVSPFPIEPSMIAARSGGDIAITYSTDACVSADHALFVGPLGDFGTVSTAECSIGSTGDVTMTLPAGNVWFLVAGIEGDSYSSVGSDVSGERVLTGVEAFCPAFTPDTSRSCP